MLKLSYIFTFLLNSDPSPICFFLSRMSSLLPFIHRAISYKTSKGATKHYIHIVEKQREKLEESVGLGAEGVLFRLSFSLGAPFFAVCALVPLSFSSFSSPSHSSSSSSSSSSSISILCESLEMVVSVLVSAVSDFSDHDNDLSVLLINIKWYRVGFQCFPDSQKFPQNRIFVKMARTDREINKL